MMNRNILYVVTIFLVILTQICSSQQVQTCEGAVEKLLQCKEKGIIEDDPKSPSQLRISPKAVAFIESTKDAQEKTRIQTLSACRALLELAQSPKCQQELNKPQVHTISAEEKLANIRRRGEFKKKADLAFRQRQASSVKRVEGIVRRQIASRPDALASRNGRQAKKRELKQRRQRAAQLEAQISQKRAQASDPAVLLSGRKRARSVVELITKSVKTPVSDVGKAVVQLGPSRVPNFVLDGPRLYTSVILVSAKRRYSNKCEICSQVHSAFREAAVVVSEAQAPLLNATLSVSADQSPLKMPANVMDPSGKDLPMVFFELDADDNMEIFRDNGIDSAPSVIVVPPSCTTEKLSAGSFIKNLPAIQRLPLRQEFTTEYVLSFASGFLNKGDSKESAKSLTSTQAASNPIADALQKVPIVVLMTAACGLVLITAFLLSYINVIFSLMSSLRPLIVIVALVFYAFNSTGGMFNKIRGAEIWPAALRRLPLLSIFTDIEPWAMTQFRDQYVVEGLIVGFMYLVVSVLLIIGVELALRVDSDMPLYRRIWAALTCHRYARPIYMLNKSVHEQATEYQESEPAKSQSNIIFRFINYVIFGFLIPLALLSAAVYAYFLITRIYTYKNASYSSEVLWSHHTISRWINIGLKKMGILYQVPGLLYSR